MEFLQRSAASVTNEFVLELTKLNNNLYELMFQTSDKFGSAVSRGRIASNPNDMSVRLTLRKDYSDKKKAGQTGRWKDLLYEGYFNGSEFRGSWYYLGFEYDSSYSGEFRMYRWNV